MQAKIRDKGMHMQRSETKVCTCRGQRQKVCTCRVQEQRLCTCRRQECRCAHGDVEDKGAYTEVRAKGIDMLRLEMV